MMYRAILDCRTCKSNGNRTKDTTLFDYEGEYVPGIRAAQDAIDEFHTKVCDQCSDSNWRVLEVNQVIARGT